MEEYPSQIIVGLPPYQEIYHLRSEQLLIQFNDEVEDSDVERVLKESKLKEFSSVDYGLGKIPDPQHVAKVKWVAVASQDDFPSLLDFSERLQKKWSELIKMITPVYYEEGLGAESAASPLSDVVVIKFKPQQSEKKIIDNLEQEMNLKYNQVRSDLLKPFHYFSVRPTTTSGEGVEETTSSSGQRLSNAFEIADNLLNNPNIEIVEYEWFKLRPYHGFVPNDTLWTNQWNMTTIDMPNAWRTQRGNAAVSIAIIDSGFDLAHPDLVFTPNTAPNFTHFNAAEWADAKLAPYDAGPSTAPHGTAVAGIAAATLNNTAGVAGVAGGCRIMPVKLRAFPFTDVDLATSLNWVAEMDPSRRAKVANMSVVVTSAKKVVDAIENAWAKGLVLCASTGNDNRTGVNFPASHANVIAVGASDQADFRKSLSSADRECWGSNFGTELDVMAPGVLCWTTDERGRNGFNKTNGGPITAGNLMMGCATAGVSYPSSGDAAGDYFSVFSGTSAACPHVAGLAALLFSQYPALTNQQVRNIIERTCQKVNPTTYAYADDPAHPNGTWNQEMGYGRVNAFRALDFADVMIRDWSGDTGIEPSSPPSGDFWDNSDIVVRPSDDTKFEPRDPEQSSKVKRGQRNILKVRVVNNGPNTARNVEVITCITPFVGLEFVYPTDWLKNDAEHVRPRPLSAPVAKIPSGGSIIAKFEITSAQVEELNGWISSKPWRPCLLAYVKSENDYAFHWAPKGRRLVTRLNNLAQRNLSVIESAAGHSFSFPFMAANLQSSEEIMELVVEKSKLPQNVELLLSIEEDGKAFPRVDFRGAATSKENTRSNDNAENIVFLERAKIEMNFSAIQGVLTVEKGSRFDFQKSKIGRIDINGGELILRGNKRLVKIMDSSTIIRMEKQPYQIYPMALQVAVPEDAQMNDTYVIRVSQRNQRGFTIGGATLFARIK